MSKDSYCNSGIGKQINDPFCSCRYEKIDRKLNGGPDLSKAMQEADSKGTPGLNLLIPDSIKTKSGLSQYLIESGFIRGTPEYLEAYKQYSGNFTEY